MNYLFQNFFNSFHHSHEKNDRQTLKTPPNMEIHFEESNNGLSNSQFKSITLKKFQKDSEFLTEKCPICLEEFKNSQKVKTLNCRHCYHTKCLEIWVKSNRFCPFCKRVI